MILTLQCIVKHRLQCHAKLSVVWAAILILPTYITTLRGWHEANDRCKSCMFSNETLTIIRLSKAKQPTPWLHIIDAECLCGNLTNTINELMFQLTWELS